MIARTRLPLLLAAVLAAAGSRLARAQAEAAAPDAETVQSAELLLRKSLQVDPEGQHHLLLRALRHLGDPELKPLFSHLAASEQASLRVHGILGLAECDPQHKLDLVRLTEINDPALEAQVVSAAIDSDLLDAEAAKRLLEWPGLDIAVRTIVATGLMKNPQAQPPRDLLIEGTKADNLARRSLAHLLLLQSGDDGAMDALRELDKSGDPKRDQVREMLLQTMLRYEFARPAPWAMGVASEPGVNPRLGLFALRIALRFNAPGAADLWRQQLASSTDPAMRSRLALLALSLSPWMEAKLYEPLLASDDDLVRRIGAAATAVASKAGVADAVRALIAMNHPLANSWALGYAKDSATPADAEAIFLELIRSAGSGPDRNRAQRLDDAVAASEYLTNHDAAAAARLLRPLLTAPAADGVLMQAILVGLIRSKGDRPQRVVEGLLPLPDPDANRMAALLLAKNGDKLTPEQLRDLSLAVRSPGMRTLRVQAAWVYLKVTGQTQQAITQVLGEAE